MVASAEPEVLDGPQSAADLIHAPRSVCDLGNAEDCPCRHCMSQGTWCDTKLDSCTKVSCARRLPFKPTRPVKHVAGVSVAGSHECQRLWHPCAPWKDRFAQESGLGCSLAGSGPRIWRGPELHRMQTRDTQPRLTPWPQDFNPKSTICAMAPGDCVSTAGFRT